MTEEIKYLDIHEFWEVGFLQEANRRFFHPLGLALEVSDVDADDVYDTLKIWDYRDDPEGIIFSPGTIDEDKIHRVYDESLRHIQKRLALMGSVIQRADSELQEEGS